ncbi:MAG: NAD(P)-dependent oxidoreductase [Proteobacteria bacterium]|nr:NAD(P)-dependent oxidoreductase [Pseudomonadota bacterium]
MSEKLLKFISLDRQAPQTRDVAERRGDFAEIYDDFRPAGAADQAARCSQCGIPFCQVHCPLGNDIPDWLMLTANGRLEEAYAVASATNTFPEICGRICPQDRLCEGNCVIEKDFDAVTIGAVESHIVETAFAQGWVKPPRPRHERDQSVGVIGGGPAGLAAADRLRRAGYAVTVYDRHDRIGGLLVYGIPNFKLDKHVVARRVALFEEAGIVFHTDFEVGRQESFEALAARHDALLVATGVYGALDMAMPGSGLANIVPALDYLIASNRKGLGDSVPAFDTGGLDAKGKNVVVIGGGDTGMDCVRTALRQGADNVTCLYRRDRQNMPGSQREVSHAMEEGVHFEWLAAPEAFLGNDAVSGVRALRMRLGAPDAEGRQTPRPIPDSSFTLPCDLAIKALGFEAEDLPAAFAAPRLKLTRHGTLKVAGSSHMTSLDGVFAAGDITRGASLVVWAIKEGRDAADGIDAYLRAKTRAVA